MNELARYLFENICLDFQGSITIDQVRQYLRDDDSRAARALLSKLIEDGGGVDELMVAVADCLKEYIRSGINEDVIFDQLITYAES